MSIRLIAVRGRQLGAALLPAFLLALPAVTRGAAHPAAASACWGPLVAAPSAVPIGGALTLSGARYRCTTPAGGLLTQAAIILYRPGLGFAIFTAHIRANGTYSLTVTVPARLRAESAINGGADRSVTTRPGTYYLTVRLFDVSLPPPSEADARVTVLPAAPTPVPAPATPSAAQISAVMARTVEVRNRAARFVPAGRPLTVDDGRGAGTLTAVVGARSPAANGPAPGQLVFFWHNAAFLGWDAGYETGRVLRLAAPAAGAFTITYARYRPHDAPCCPSLTPLVVHSGWSGTILISDGVPPPAPGAPATVTLLR